MTIPAPQKDYEKRTVRLPPELLDELKKSAAQEGYSVNTEIILRLRGASVAAELAALTKSNEELRAMIRQLIEK